MNLEERREQAARDVAATNLHHRHDPWELAQDIVSAVGGISPLKAHRIARGWSRQHTVEAASRIAAAAGLPHRPWTVELLAGWEDGHAVPDDTDLDVINHLFGADPVFPDYTPAAERPTPPGAT